MPHRIVTPKRLICFFCCFLTLSIFIRAHAETPPNVKEKPAFPSGTITVGSKTLKPGETTKGNAILRSLQAQSATGNVLYAQELNNGGYVVVSQNFEPSLSVYDSQLADDFVVPEADGSWKVNTVSVTGRYFEEGQGPATSVNVKFYKNNNGVPGLLIKNFSSLSYQSTDLSGDYKLWTIDLPTEAIFLPGTYWISVQANLNYSPGDHVWGWNFIDAQKNFKRVWRNPLNGWNRGCTTWTSDCPVFVFNEHTYDGDAMFTLYGSCELAPCGQKHFSLPQTGQKRCFNENGYEEFCLSTKQDGDYKSGKPWPSVRFVDNANGTITDMLTGLSWIRDGNCAGPVTWVQALQYVSDFNDNPSSTPCAQYTGTDSDWRLPNINELGTLFNENQADNKAWLELTQNGFVNIVSGSYWSSTSLATVRQQAWTLHMNDGSVINTPKSDLNGSLMLVRGKGLISVTGQTNCSSADGILIDCKGTGQDGEHQSGVDWTTSVRFTDNGDGTVTDHLTNLVWLKDMGCLPRSNWTTGFASVNTLNTEPATLSCAEYAADFTDWRMPNRLELASMLYFNKALTLPTLHPFILPSVFMPFATSTTTVAVPENFWNVQINSGRTIQVNKVTADQNIVWPVRGAYGIHKGFQYPINYEPDYPQFPQEPSAWTQDKNGYGSLINVTNNPATGGFSEPHGGEDWNQGGGCDDAGREVVSIANGIVVAIDHGSTVPGWGYTILVRHDAPPGQSYLSGTGEPLSTVYAMYAHLLTQNQDLVPSATWDDYDASKNLQGGVGTYVRKGDPIGQIGDGNGVHVCHLHLEILKDVDVFNPQSYPGATYNWSRMARTLDPSEFIDNNRSPGQEAFSILVHPYDGNGSFQLDGATPTISANVIGNWTRQGFQESYGPSQLQIGYSGQFFSKAGDTNGTVKWTPNLPRSGDYKISVFIPVTYGTTHAANYVLKKGNGTVIANWSIDQSQHENEWVEADTFTLDPTDAPYISLDGNVGVATEMVSADAVKFQYVPNAEPPEGSFSPSFYNFGTVTQGVQSANKTLSITNSASTTPLIIDSILIGGDNADEFSLPQTNCTGNTLAPGQSCSINVNILARSIGSKRGELKVSARDMTHVLVAPLRANAVMPPPPIEVSPTNHSFPDVRVNASTGKTTFTITNSGSKTQKLQTIGLSGDHPGQFKKSDDKCANKTLPAFAQCTFNVRFKPTSKGDKSAKINVAIKNLESLSIPLAGKATVAPTQDENFVYRAGNQLKYKMLPYRFIGVNMRGIAYESDDEIIMQLREAGKMGANVVRIFISKNDKDINYIKSKLGNIINISRRADLISEIRTSLNNQTFEFKFVVSLVDFYNNSGHYLAKDQTAYAQRDPINRPDDMSVLKFEWFRKDPNNVILNYEDFYKPFVAQLVAEFWNNEAIIAWELGNEIQAQSADDMLAFIYDMGAFIKTDLTLEIVGVGTLHKPAAKQMVTTGFISARHASNATYNNRDVSTVLTEMYLSWNGRNSPISIGSIHAYNNEQEFEASKNPSWYKPQHNHHDLAWFATNNYPFFVGEGGFDGAGSEGKLNCIKDQDETHNPPHWVGYLPDDPKRTDDDTYWGDVYIPGTQAYRAVRIDTNGTITYEGAIPATVSTFFDVYGADGYMQWGFMAGDENHDNNQGDECNGLDRKFHNADWNDMYLFYRDMALGMANVSLVRTENFDTTQRINPQGSSNYSLLNSTVSVAPGKETAVIESTNLLDGVTDISLVTNFLYDLVSLPAGTSVSIQYSQDAISWVDSSGMADGVDILDASGQNSIDLSALGWKQPSFYYKLTLQSKGGKSPVLANMAVTYAPRVCAPPISGDWIVTKSCTLTGQLKAPANVHVRDGAVLTISKDSSLDIDFIKHSLTVKNGSGVLIKSGGKID